MHAYYIATLLHVLEPTGMSREQLLDGTGVSETDPQAVLNLTAEQLDTACTNALFFSKDSYKNDFSHCLYFSTISISLPFFDIPSNMFFRL